MSAPYIQQGPFQQPFDPSVYTFTEDFTHCATSAALSGATLLSMQNSWVAQNIGTNANCKVVFAYAADGIHAGVVGLNANNTGAGNGVCLFLGGGAASVGFFNPNANAFVYKSGFQMSTNTNIAVFLGFGSNSQQSTPPNVNTSLFCGVSYDTTLSDANLMFRTQSTGAAGNAWIDTGVIATTGWHHMTMWGSGQGTVFCQVDNGAVVSSSNTPFGLLDFGYLMMVTRATGIPQLNVDYVGMQVTGLNR